MAFFNRMSHNLSLRNFLSESSNDEDEMDLDEGGEEDFPKEYKASGESSSRLVKQFETGSDISNLVMDVLESSSNQKEDILLWMLCLEDPSSWLERSEHEHPPGRGVCGKVWEVNDIVVKCRDCEFDPSSAICIDCFKHGDHKGHDVTFIKSGGGCCDCGNPQAWKPHGFCRLHPGPFHDVNPLDNLKDEMSWKNRILISTVLGQLSALFVKFIGLRRTKGSRAQRILSEISTIIGFLVEITSRNDAFHRIVCEEFLREMDFDSKDAMSDLADIDYARRKNWDIMKFSRSVQSRLYVTLFFSSDFPMENRMEYYKFLFILISDNLFKSPFSVVFCSMYRDVITPRSNDEEERRYTSNLHAFSVQLFTVQELVPYLFKNLNMSDILLDFFIDFIRGCKRTDDYMGVIEATENNIKQKKYFNVLVDLQYSCTHVNVSRTALYSQYPDFLDKWMDILVGFQGMNPIVRKKFSHVERELNSWVNAFNVELDLLMISNFLRRGIASPYEEKDVDLLPTPKPDREFALHMMERIYERCIGWVNDVIGKFSRNGDKKNPPPFLSSYRSEDHQVTWTLPLFRFFAMFLIDVTSEWNIDITEIRWRRYGEIISYILGIFSAQAQIFAGKWVRNGESIQTMARQYEGMICSRKMFDLDVFLLQYYACVLADVKDMFFRRFINSYGLYDRIYPLNDELATENVLDAVDLNNSNIYIMEFLRAVSHLISERYYVGRYSAKDVVRREVIHRLALGEFTHSQLYDSLPRNIYAEKHFEDVLREVADTKESPKGNELLYKLKDQLWSEFSPNFFHYSRSDAAAAEDQYYLHLKALKPELTTKVVPPPVHLAELKPTFSKLQSSVCYSRTLHRVLFSIVYNSLASSFPTPATQLHLTLTIIYYCIDESVRIREKNGNMIVHLPEGTIEAFLSADDGRYNFNFESDDILENLRVRILMQGIHSGKRIQSKLEDDEDIVPGAEDEFSTVSFANLLAFMHKSTVETFVQLKPLLKRIRGKAMKVGIDFIMELDKARARSPSNASISSKSATGSTDPREKMAERQKRIMERFMNQQNAFSKAFENELESVDAEEEEDMAEESFDLFDCVQCQARLEGNTGNSMVLLANISRSSVVRFANSHVRGAVYQDSEPAIDPIESTKPFHDPTYFRPNPSDILRKVLAEELDTGEMQMEEDGSAMDLSSEAPPPPPPPPPSQSMDGDDGLGIAVFEDEDQEETPVKSNEDTFITDMNLALVSADDDSAHVIKSCWHSMHMSCFASFYSYYVTNNIQPYRSEGDPIEKRNGDFTCPLCRSVCNSVVPILSYKRKNASLLDVPLPPPGDNVSHTSILFKQLCSIATRHTLLSIENEMNPHATSVDSMLINTISARGNDSLSVIALLSSTLSNIEHASRAIFAEGIAPGDGYMDALRQRIASTTFLEEDGGDLLGNTNDLALCRYVLWNNWVNYNTVIDEDTPYARIREILFRKLSSVFLEGEVPASKFNLVLELDPLSLCIFFMGSLRDSKMSHVQKDNWFSSYASMDEYDNILRICSTVALSQALLSLWKSKALPISYPQIVIGADGDDAGIVLDIVKNIDIAEVVKDFCKNYGEDSIHLDLETEIGMLLHLVMASFIRRIALVKFISLNHPTRLVAEKKASALTTTLREMLPTECVQSAVMLVRNVMAMDFAFFKRLSPCVPMLLVSLPEKYQSLFSIVDPLCEICGMERTNPAICLICGATLCAGGTCSAVSGLKPVTAHAHLHSGSCAFLFTKNAYYFLFYTKRDQKAAGSFFQALYVDKWGEEDRGLKRGRLMDLQPQRLEVLRKKIIQNNIQNEVNWGSNERRLLLNNY